MDLADKLLVSYLAAAGLGFLLAVPVAGPAAPALAVLGIVFLVPAVTFLMLLSIDAARGRLGARQPEAPAPLTRADAHGLGLPWLDDDGTVSWPTGSIPAELRMSDAERTHANLHARRAEAERARAAGEIPEAPSSRMVRAYLMAEARAEHRRLGHRIVDHCDRCGCDMVDAACQCHTLCLSCGSQGLR